MKAKKVAGPPTCHQCNTLLIGSDRNVCPKCSIKYCSLCHGGVYYIDPVTKVEAKNCSTCADSPDEEDKQTVSPSSSKLRTNRHFHAELRRKQTEKLLAKHQLAAEAANDVEGQQVPAKRATTDPTPPRLRRGVAAVIKRKAPKPTNVDIEFSSDDENSLDLDEKLGYWEGTEDESEVKTMIMTRLARQKKSNKEKPSKPQRTQKKDQIYHDANDTQESAAGPDRGKLTRALKAKNANMLQPKASEPGVMVGKPCTAETRILTGNKIYVCNNQVGNKSNGKTQQFPSLIG